MSWRPKEGWEDKKIMRSWGKLTLEGEYEAGADAEWQAVQDYIAELSDTYRDDKMFRIKLFLWLTAEEENERVKRLD